MLDDRQLLERYVSAASEEAFAELVRRHMGLVYSAALRQVREPHKAQDVTQMVFANLARKAASIPPQTVLAGWLHRDTRYTALDLLRAEARRSRREQQAVAMSVLNDSALPPWEHIRPLLDEVLQEMAPADRDALLLRFFEQRDFAAVGAGLGATTEAARKRVERALNRLRERLVKRGVTTTAAALAGALSAHALEPIPAGLALSLLSGSTAAATAAATPSATSWLSHLLLMSKTKFALSALLLAGALTTPLLVQQQVLARARVEHSLLEARLRDAPPAPTSAAPSDSAGENPQVQRKELQRLRSEAAQLKTRVAELTAQAQRTGASTPAPRLKGTPINQSLNPLQARDVGQATPAALLQTFLAAVLQPDTNRLSQLFAVDPATEPARYQKMLQDLDEQAAHAGAADAPLEVRLLEEQPAGNNELWLVHQDVRKDGTAGSPERILLRQTDLGWKVVLGTNGVPVTRLEDQP